MEQLQNNCQPILFRPKVQRKELLGFPLLDNCDRPRTADKRLTK
jgi:hypothetical protein